MGPGEEPFHSVHEGQDTCDDREDGPENEEGVPPIFVERFCHVDCPVSVNSYSAIILLSMDGAQADLDWTEGGMVLFFELVPRQGDQHESEQANQRADGEGAHPQFAPPGLVVIREFRAILMVAHAIKRMQSNSCCLR
jgi:hypothetical protein